MTERPLYEQNPNDCNIWRFKQNLFRCCQQHPSTAAGGRGEEESQVFASLHVKSTLLRYRKFSCCHRLKIKLTANALTNKRQSKIAQGLTFSSLQTLCSASPAKHNSHFLYPISKLNRLTRRDLSSPEQYKVPCGNQGKDSPILLAAGSYYTVSPVPSPSF